MFGGRSRSAERRDHGEITEDLRGSSRIPEERSGGAAALVTTTPLVEAQAPGNGTGAAPAAGAAPAPTQAQLARDAGNVRPPAVPARTITRAGSDLMVQTIRDLGIEYVAANPGSSFEGLQESFINYGNPPNQDAGVHHRAARRIGGDHGARLRQGRRQADAGAAARHHRNSARGHVDLSGLLRSRAGRDARRQRPGLHRGAHRARYGRDGSKLHQMGCRAEDASTRLWWPFSAPTTKPLHRRMGPTLVVLSSDLQKDNAPNAKVPAYKPPQFVTLDATRAKEIAKGLVEAQNPRIAVGRLRTPEGVKRAVELAELVGASTSTAATNGPMSFPQRHRALWSRCGHDLRLHARPGNARRAGFHHGSEPGESRGDARHHQHRIRWH